MKTLTDQSQQENKSIHVTFITRICLVVYLNETQIPQAKDTKFLGMHLDGRQLN